MNELFALATAFMMLSSGRSTAGEGQNDFLRFSNDIGIPPEYISEYSIDVKDSGIVTYERSYDNGLSDDDEPVDGGTYFIIYTFRGIKPGMTVVTASQRTPDSGTDDYDYKYIASVDADLNVKLIHVQSVLVPKFDENEDEEVEEPAE